jgi:hypothetical protein
MTTFNLPDLRGAVPIGANDFHLFSLYPRHCPVYNSGLCDDVSKSKLINSHLHCVAGYLPFIGFAPAKPMNKGKQAAAQFR